MARTGDRDRMALIRFDCRGLVRVFFSWLPTTHRRKRLSGGYRSPGTDVLRLRKALARTEPHTRRVASSTSCSTPVSEGCPERLKRLRTHRVKLPIDK